MRTQIIQDHNGVPAGVFIPMKDWEKIIKEYPEIVSDNTFELSEQQKKILDSQDNLTISDFQDNDEFLAELKAEYGL